MDLQQQMLRNRTINRQDTLVVPQDFLDAFPDLAKARPGKPTKAEELFHRYCRVVGLAISKVNGFVDENQRVQISIKKLMDGCGTFNSNKQRYWLWNEFKDRYPLIQVISTGSNLSTEKGYKKYSTVQVVNREKRNMIIEHVGGEDLLLSLYGQDSQSQFQGVRLDLQSLQNYLDCTTHMMAHPKSQNYLRKLEKNYDQALLVRKIARYTEEVYGEAFLPLVEKPSAYGRMYYRGLSVQSVSREVRGAMLGNCYQYDINAAVFATKLLMFSEIKGGDNQLVEQRLASYTREYLANKTQIRKRLADKCYQGIEVSSENAIRYIKQALTAIGFGARTTGHTWPTPEGIQGTALADILKSSDARERFLADGWVVNFLREQQEIEDALLEALKANKEFYEHIAAIVRESNKNKISRARMLACLYQHEEKRLMNEMIQLLNEHGIEPLADIHDAMIVRKMIPVEVLKELRVRWGDHSYLTVDCDEIHAWKSLDYLVNAENADNQKDQHRHHMLLEQRNAAMVAVKRQGGEPEGVAARSGQDGFQIQRGHNLLDGVFDQMDRETRKARRDLGDNDPMMTLDDCW